MIEEILPNLYRTEIPLPKSPLKWLNSYIVKGEDRFLIIDTGFNHEVCLNAMNTTLQKLDVDLNRTDFFITHLHADHMGLTGTLVSAGSKVYFNEHEAHKLYAQHADTEGYWQNILDVYIANGFNVDVARKSMESHPAHKYVSKKTLDFSVVNDGHQIEVGDFHFKCIATPGHSPGHMSLYDAKKKILIAGDHILFDITPNITYWVDMEDALGQYLSSLEKVDALDVDLVLTGHRRLVHDLHGRVQELQEHHRQRLDEVLVALGDGEKNILQTAPHIKWDITAESWEAFPPQQKWFAFGETMAHVKYLETRGKVRRKNRDGITTYALA
jgi:glyoxylase-like metal-dependent hydrolase (beta-lactamase superfamily II)